MNTKPPTDKAPIDRLTKDKRGRTRPAAGKPAAKRDEAAPANDWGAFALQSANAGQDAFAALVSGAQSLRQFQLDAGRQALARHEKFRELINAAADPPGMARIHAELWDADLKAVGQYWWQVLSICALARADMWVQWAQGLGQAAPARPGANPGLAAASPAQRVDRELPPSWGGMFTPPTAAPGTDAPEKNGGAAAQAWSGWFNAAQPWLAVVDAAGRNKAH